LALIREIRDRSNIIDRRLGILLSKVMFALTSRVMVATLFVLFLLALPGFYLYRVYRTDHAVGPQAVQVQVQQDVKALRAAATSPNTPLLERAAATLAKTTEIIHAVPSILLFLGGVLAIARRILLRGGRAHSSLASFERGIRMAANDLKGD